MRSITANAAASDTPASAAPRLPPQPPGTPTSRRVPGALTPPSGPGIADYAPVLVADLEAVEELRFRTFTPQELIAIGLSQPPTGVPGERWSYSNTGYVILGLLIERLTGGPYAEEISRRILRPLGLRHTYFRHEPVHPRPAHGRVRGVARRQPARRALLTGQPWWRSRAYPRSPGGGRRGGLRLHLRQTGHPATPCGRVWGRDGCPGPPMASAMNTPDRPSPPPSTPPLRRRQVGSRRESGATTRPIGLCARSPQTDDAEPSVWKVPT